MQGCGVNTPSAAAVAAATWGLARLRHMPNGMMLTIEMWSMMLAAYWLPHITRLVGKTTRLYGGVPNEDIKGRLWPPCIGMALPPGRSPPSAWRLFRPTNHGAGDASRQAAEAEVSCAGAAKQ